MSGDSIDYSFPMSFAGKVYTASCARVDKYYLLDVDHSDEVRKAIQNHERRNCWEEHRRGLIRFAVLYTADMTAEERGKLEEKIRREYKTIPCLAHPTEAPR